MTILDISFFNFWNSTKSISSEALNPLKTISDDSIWCPKGHPSIPRKSQNLHFFHFDHVWSLWTLYVCSGDMCVLLRHGICCMDTRDVFLWEKNMSSCWRRIYGYGRCLLVGEEYILVLVLVFIFLVLFLCCWCCLKLFSCALRLAAGAFFWRKKTH